MAQLFFYREVLMKSKTELLHEMVGTLTTKPTQPEYTRQSSDDHNQIEKLTLPDRHFEKGLKVGYCSTMHAWQKNVVEMLAKGKDVSVVAPTSAGKTGPIICYWAKYMIGVNPDYLHPDFSSLTPNESDRKLMDAVYNIIDINRRRSVPKLII